MRLLRWAKRPATPKVSYGVDISSCRRRRISRESFVCGSFCSFLFYNSLNTFEDNSSLIPEPSHRFSDLRKEIKKKI